MTLLDLLTAPWAIEPAKLLEMQAIYAQHVRGEKIDIPAIEARLQRPLSNEQQEYRIETGGVAVLPVEGVIAAKANMFTRVSGGTSAQILQRQLESAMVDARVTSLVLDVDSGGGSVFGGPEFASAVETFAREKSIVAVSGGMIASMAYWIGASANRVFLAGPTVHAGSIGVVATHDFTPNMRGVTTEITAGKYKRIATNSAPLSAEGREYLQAQVDHLYSVFVDAVARLRRTDVGAVLEHMADGRLFIGQQALDVGLVDGFATVDAVVEQLAADPKAFATRGRAMVAVTKQPKAEADPEPQPNHPEPEGGTMPMTKEQLAASEPELLKTLTAEFVELGAKAERERILGIEAALIPGHEKLVAQLKADGKTSVGEAALAINAAERQARANHANALAEDAPAPLKQVPAKTVVPGSEDPAKAKAEERASMPLDARCKAEWEESPDLRGEFRSLGAYTAFKRAASEGKARIFGQQV